jgi:hypothetical protein
MPPTIPWPRSDIVFIQIDDDEYAKAAAAQTLDLARVLVTSFIFGPM